MVWYLITACGLLFDYGWVAWIACVAFRYECELDFSFKWLGLCRWLRFSAFTGGFALVDSVGIVVSLYCCLF